MRLLGELEERPREIAYGWGGKNKARTEERQCNIEHSVSLSPVTQI